MFVSNGDILEITRRLNKCGLPVKKSTFRYTGSTKISQPAQTEETNQCNLPNQKGVPEYLKLPDFTKSTTVKGCRWFYPKTLPTSH